MTLTLRSSTLALVALAALSGCNKAKEAPVAVPTAVALENPATPVAKYGSKTVTIKEVDEQLGAELKKLEKQKLEMRQQAAEQIAVQALVKEEAAKEGVSEKDWFAKHVDAAVPAPTEDAIKKVFEENKARMPPDASIDSMREQIIGFLSQDQRRTQALKTFGELKKKGGYQLLLAEPRTVVEAKGPTRGPPDAKVTIVEFSDFECPFCSRAEETVTQVMEHYAGKVRLVFRHFPLPMHSNAGKAAEAAACAEEQGKFWEMHKQLFANQSKLSARGSQGPCPGHWRRRGEVRRVPRWREDEGQGRRRSEGGRRGGRERDPGVLRQRKALVGGPAVPRVPAGDRRRARRGDLNERGGRSTDRRGPSGCRKGRQQIAPAGAAPRRRSQGV